MTHTATSSHFVSVIAAGESWRDTAKKVLEEIEALRTDGFQPNFGLLYVTEPLTADAGSILTLFRSVTGVRYWSGCAAFGVCGAGVEYTDQPAISVLIGTLPADKLRAFQSEAETFRALHEELEPWLNQREPMLTLLHADPLMDSHPAAAIEELDSMVGGFLVGGLTSTRKVRALIGREVSEDGISGFIFDSQIAVATTLSQGCVPMGPPHEVERADAHIIARLDGERPLDVFTQDLKSVTLDKIGLSSKEIVIEQGDSAMAEMQERMQSLFKGEAHIGFPVTGSDRQDYLVRNIMGIDPDSGMMAVSDYIEDGQKIVFMHRDDETVRRDLSQSLVALRKRITHDHGMFTPKGGLYISCVSRADVVFNEEDGKAGGEMALIREVLGDIPMAGFYAGGEICNSRLYGHSGILILFL